MLIPTKRKKRENIFFREKKSGFGKHLLISSRSKQALRKQFLSIPHNNTHEIKKKNTFFLILVFPIHPNHKPQNPYIN